MGLETLLVAGIATTLVGTGVSVYSSYQQGQSAKKIAEYNADVKNNEAIARKQVERFNIARIQEKNRRERGKRIAHIAKSGVSFSGSALDVMEDAIINGNLDVVSEKYKSNRDQRFLRDSAQLTIAEGRMRAQTANLNALGQGLEGLGQGLKDIDYTMRNT